MNTSVGEQAIIDIEPLRTPWQTEDPFLFCMHHLDQYPEGNGRFGPVASLAGRQLGQDFANRDGWNMYHGRTVPGFPRHPHRGFETVTFVRQGLLDHSDSLGATARYGEGDVQWLTAGRGISHAEMFPLVKEDANNPLELFQIWLNLPAARKMADPRFAMFWSDDVPKFEAAEGVRLNIAAGEFAGRGAPTPPEDSWARDPQNEVGIVSIALAPRAEYRLVGASRGVRRALYFFEGSELKIGSREIPPRSRIRVAGDQELMLSSENGAELLLLQGKPIGEPVAHHGPFVMNTRAELMQAFRDYQRDEFGGWPWDSAEPLHGSRGRFALRPDGTEETPS